MLRAQTYKNWHAIVMVDGGTTDATLDLALNAKEDDPRMVSVYHQSERVYGLANIVEGYEILKKECDALPDDVLLEVDGDDWLYDEHVLEKLAKVYEDPDIWLTYGSHERSTGQVIACRRYPEWVFDEKKFRHFGWWASQLRTHRRFLWDSINEDDMRDKSGELYRVTWDLSFMFPMLEMCESKNVKVFEEPLLLYNIHDGCDFIANKDLQRKFDWEIRAKKKYPQYKEISDG
jgi:glycosyltransferase involved in cell wall biosynthesis